MKRLIKWDEQTFEKKFADAYDKLAADEEKVDETWYEEGFDWEHPEAEFRTGPHWGSYSHQWYYFKSNEENGCWMNAKKSAADMMTKVKSLETHKWRVLHLRECRDSEGIEKGKVLMVIAACGLKFTIEDKLSGKCKLSER